MSFRSACTSRAWSIARVEAQSLRIKSRSFPLGPFCVPRPVPGQTPNNGMFGTYTTRICTVQPPVVLSAVAMTPRGANSGEKGYGSSVAQTSVRMPDELLRRVRAAAKRDGVSLNLWLCTAIEAKASGSLRQEDVELLRALADRVSALEKRFR